MDLFVTLLAIPIVSITAFIFGRNPYRWALYAYFFKFWVLIPLFMIKKYPTPPIPESLLNLLRRVQMKRSLRKVRYPKDLKI
jgi:hypothetical protein